MNVVRPQQEAAGQQRENRIEAAFRLEMQALSRRRMGEGSVESRKREACSEWGNLMCQRDAMNGGKD